MFMVATSRPLASATTICSGKDFLPSFIASAKSSWALANASSGSFVVGEVRTFLINGCVMIAQMEKISGHGNTFVCRCRPKWQCRCKFRRCGF